MSPRQWPGRYAFRDDDGKAQVYTLKEEEIEMNTMEVEQNQTLMNIVQMTYSDYLRETASRDHFRNAEASTVKGSVRASVDALADSARDVICQIAPLQTTSVCAVPA